MNKYHIMRHSKGWQIKKEKGKRASYIFNTKEEALKFAKSHFKNTNTILRIHYIKGNKVEKNIRFKMVINNTKCLGEFYEAIIPTLLELGIIDDEDIHEASRLPGWSTIKEMYMGGMGSDEQKEAMIEMYVNTFHN